MSEMSFSMKYSTLERLSSEIQRMSEDFSSVRDALRTTVESLDGSWEGKAHDRFAERFKKLDPKLNTIAEVLSSYASSIAEIVANEEELEKVSSGFFVAVGTYMATQPGYSSNHNGINSLWTDVHSVETPLNGQHTNYTCAFASGSMLLNAIGVSASEEDISRITGGDNNLYQVNKAMNQLSGGKFEEIHCNRNINSLYDQITTSLDKGTPVQINVRMSNNEPFGYPSDGHYVVVTGVYTDENGNRMVQINDPFSPQYYSQGIKEGQQIEMPLSSLFDAWGHQWLIVGK